MHLELAHEEFDRMIPQLRIDFSKEIKDQIREMTKMVSTNPRFRKQSRTANRDEEMKGISCDLFPNWTLPQYSPKMDPNDDPGFGNDIGPG